MRYFRLAGTRTVKTGIAIFITAWVCVLLDWPPVFAVITAIVTIEPTVADSIRKGIVRFPASAIGSAYAVLFISLFGNSPLTYTLAAVFTIATCFKLRLHAGLLVATLTAVAMVEVIHSNYFIAFLIRLGTTTTGLLVSTLVNMFVLPPDYTKEITKNIQQISKQTGRVIHQSLTQIVEQRNQIGSDTASKLNELAKKLHHTELLIKFQQDESKYHPLVGNEKELFHHGIKQINQLKLMHYHLNNLMNTPPTTKTWRERDRAIMLQAANELTQSLEDQRYYDPVRHQKQLEQLMEIYWVNNEEIINEQAHPANFPPKLIIMYEFVTIYSLVAQFYPTLTSN
ncbi:aromatic acid exporter family protein [Lentibacillus sp. N15]|uniref:aromatic acid exporter family protein n=1 Tax=Lentibacillus songyuanensis TaxID=3136161 RepID=UPI0031BB01A6